MQRRGAICIAVLVIASTFGAVGAFGSSVAEGAAVGHSANLGINVTYSTKVNSDIAAYALTGAKWIRFDAFWDVIEPWQNPDTTLWSWTKLDDEVRVSEKHGLRVLLMPDYAPPWAQVQKPKCRSDRCAPASALDYAYFVAAVADRYRTGGAAHTHVHSYEIWNEPNGPGFSPNPDPKKYVQMLRLSYRVIQSEDRGADVITGGLAPSDTLVDPKTKKIVDYSPLDFLTAIYKDGAHGSFTAVGNHPYSGMSSPLFNATWNAFRNTPKLYALMKRHGDGKKKIWGTETGYSSSDAWGVGAAIQAKFLLEDVTDWFKWSFAGPLFVYNWRDTDDLGANKFDTDGLVNFDGTPKPALAEFIVAAAGS
jgi:hypothetical protein